MTQDDEATAKACSECGSAIEPGTQGGQIGPCRSLKGIRVYLYCVACEESFQRATWRDANEC